jgi:hypothetical protein
MMTKDDAISAAETFVTRHYPKLPEFVMVFHLTEREGRIFGECWFREPRSARWRESAMWVDQSSAEHAGLGDQWRELTSAAPGISGIAGKWTVHFFMSWDTDTLGMPETLAIMIDDADGSVTRVSPDRAAS